VDNSTQDVVGVFIFFLGGPAHHQAPTIQPGGVYREPLNTIKGITHQNFY
tara:strand:+ start:132 stop:281 length:150 start_codon:yes stop_codon:yes gene_type:complete